MSRGVLHLAVVGDLMLGRGVDAVMRGAGGMIMGIDEEVSDAGLAYPWGDLIPELRAADLTIGNLECCISERGSRWDPVSKPFHFRAGPWAAPSLAAAGFDFVSLANNHLLDYGAVALEDTLSYLSRHGVAHTGAGRDLAEASQPALFETRGWRIAVIAAADHPTDFAATPTSPGTRVIRPDPVDPGGAELIHDVERLRRSGYHLVVVSLHWGPNMNRAPLPGFPEYARALIDAGAGLVHGHSAHLFQGVEFYRGAPILYDTGDFVDDYAVDPDERNDLQFLFQLEFEAGKATRVGMVPVQIEGCRVRRARPAERRWLFERMRLLSAEFGTSCHEGEGRLALHAG
jgi:poly-gamma-glutamate synthesis protein (capsule biosynthesis protein)